MLRRDMPQVLEIEKLCFEYPWDEDSFIRCLRERNCIGMVSHHKKADKVVSFVIYELHKTRLHVLNFAVEPRFQRAGIGAAMMLKLKAKLTPGKRSSIVANVRESNLDAQLFFKAQGFRAISVLCGLYEQNDDDCYLFQYRVQSGAKVAATQDACGK